MTEFWLIRHGQTDWNLHGRWQGQASFAPGLNETGFAQARALATELSHIHFAAVYSSDLLRARQTAETVAKQHGLPVLLDARLREVNLGEWEGLLSEDVISGYSNELKQREENPLHARPPQGESLAEVAERARAALMDISRHQPHGPVVIVSHGLTLASVICLANQIPLEDAYQHVPENAAPYLIKWQAGL
ncbi:MAG: histidine phosphatase family protein [Anaerolineales bacterium]|nr:MAG: histidine phosphatase family protein [Anaerolineales bacterium]